MIQKIVPDILAVLGLALLGYGLYLFLPWVSFAVCGALLILSGVFLGRNEHVQDKGGEF